MDKRDQIIRIATKLFSERGFDKTPLSVVCEEANVSKGLIFHHFKNKNDLLREIFKTTTELIIEINQPQNTNQTAQEKLLKLIESFFSQLKTDKLFFQLNLNVMLQPTTRDILGDLIKERSSFIMDSVKVIFDDINPTNSLVKSHLFISELDGIALNYLGIFDEFPLEEIKKEMILKYA